MGSPAPSPGKDGSIAARRLLLAATRMEREGFVRG